MNEILIINEEYWRNSQLSIVRHFGQAQINGHTFIIVDKHGRDIFECSRIAKKEGRNMAIEPGEPCDLCRDDLIPAYRALGRDRIIALILEGKSANEIKTIAGFKPKRKNKDRIKHQPTLHNTK